MARALTNTCESSPGDAVVERRIKTIVEGRELYPIHRLVESKTFDGTAIVGRSDVEHTLDIASVVNAFCIFVFVYLFFLYHPIFAWIALSGFQSTGE